MVGAVEYSKARWVALIASVTREHPSAHWLATLRAAGLTVVAMRRLEDLLDDPHLAATGFFQQATGPDGEALRLLRPAGDWSDWRHVTRRAPPRLGEHTREVLDAANGW